MTNIDKIRLVHPNLEIIEHSGIHVIVRDDYGICKVQIHSLLYGSKPTIGTAINKTEYFKNKLKEIQPNLTVVGEYIGQLSKIKVKDKYGICDSFRGRLLAGAIPCIETAINKTDYFINQAKEIHGDTYDYSKLNYINAKNKVTLICKKHGEFSQLPNHHLINQGCRKCGNKDKGSGWYKHVENFDRLSTLYILQFSNEYENFVKFGVTVNLQKRLEALNRETNYIYKIKLIKKIEGTANYCYQLEQRFKKRIWRNRRTYKPSVEFGGMWECFK